VTLGWSTSFGVDQLGRREHSMPKATVAGATVVDDTAEQGFVWVSEPLPVRHGGETPSVATGDDAEVEEGDGSSEKATTPAGTSSSESTSTLEQNSTTSDPSRPETAPTAEQPSEQEQTDGSGAASPTTTSTTESATTSRRKTK
jgi:hypothetical protein